MLALPLLLQRDHEQAGPRMRLTLINPAQAQEQSQSPSTTQDPVVPAPPTRAMT